MSSATLEKLQAASGLAFSSFLGLHLANAWLAAPLGQVAYDEVQAVLRRWYQLPLFAEPLVVFLPLGVHAVTSAALVYRRLQRAKELSSADASPTTAPRAPWHLTLHRYSGYLAAALVGGHVLATRGPSWFLGHLPADFSTVAFTMEGLLAPLFYPYYVIFSSAAAYHALYGTSQALRVLLPAEWTYKSRFAWVRSLFRVEKKHVFNTLIVMSTALSIVAASAFAGFLFPILDKERFAEHRQLYARFVPSFLL